MLTGGAHAVICTAAPAKRGIFPHLQVLAECVLMVNVTVAVKTMIECIALQLKSD
jgi:hypothetical protein